MVKLVQREKVEQVLGHHLTKRVLVVKGIVSLSFLAYFVDHSLGMPVALVGNVVWLWVEAK